MDWLRLGGDEVDLNVIATQMIDGVEIFADITPATAAHELR